MNEQDALLQAIIEHPEDDELRLVYADWLEEHGDSARAEFIRVQCALARMAEDDDRLWGLRAREHQLLEGHEKDWFPLADVPQYCGSFRRGFVEIISADAG